MSGKASPALVPLAGDEGFAGLALRLQRIEFLLEPSSEDGCRSRSEPFLSRVGRGRLSFSLSGCGTD
jgi:hypothetical protein